MDELNNLQTTVRTLKGNELLVLDDPRTTWVVDTGSVALFEIALRDDRSQGARRFLFTSGSGEALFGFAKDPEERPVIAAVALEDSVLRGMSTDELAASEGASHLWFERWVERWAGHVGLVETDAEPDGEEGPLTIGSVERFNRVVLERVAEIREKERRRDRARFEDRDRKSQLAAEQAVAELSSVLGPGEVQIVQGSDLFVAASAVARTQGIELRAPAAWEEQAAVGDPMERIARVSHVRARKVVLHDRWWTRDCGAIVGFEGEQRTPVALLPRTTRSYDILRPGERARTRVDPEAASQLDPEAYVFYRPLPERADRGLELLKFALAGRSRDLLLIFATAVGATLLGMLTPQATSLLVDHAIPDANTDMLFQVGLGLLAAAFGIGAFRLAQGIVMMRLQTGADAATQAAVWDRLLNLQLSFFRKYSTGDLQSRVTAVSQIRSYLGGATLRSLFSSIVLLLNLGLLTYYSPMLTVVAVGVAAVSAAVTILSGVMILRCTRQIWELKGKFFGLMVQLVNGVAKIRVAAAEERAFAKWAREYARLLKLELRERTINDSVQVINIAVSTLSAIVLFAVAARLIRQSDTSGLTAGMFLAFNVAYGTFIGAIANLSNTVTDVLAIAILRERARPILSATPEISDRKADPGPLNGRMQLDHVTFQYSDEGPVILDDVSLGIDAGQFVALVGPSGSGKSTILRLLLGFESPRSGTIFYDGQDLGGLDVHAVRRQMGVVLQNGRINAGSLFDNIASGTRVSLNDAWEAARSTGFAEEIQSMPMGMHTVISEGGTNLSGGQRQRLLLARAIVHKPKVLLLDEATSAMDNKTQAIVSDSLQILNITRVVIAHRLSTVRHADRIFVVESGRIVEQGSFDELAEQQGLFSRLMARQLA